MPDSSQDAVFLSYASQDVIAARRVAETLRAAGIEVWLDESALRSGDEWDPCIRGQIRACTLFLPIVSASTEARREGYFRREWHLAAERTLDIARGVPFLVPIVIDDTSERTALVPPEFLRVQWTRLRDGAAPPDFARRVEALIAATKRAPPSSRPVAASDAAEAPRPPNRWWPTAAAISVVALLAVAGWFARKGESTTEAAPGGSAGAGSDQPSIAVLAFDNLTGDRENDYLSDGISEELLNSLARVPGLRVAARKSAFSFKGSAVPLAEITRRLHVHYVLDGTVRRDGSKLRIGVELIKAADGFHAWSGRFEKEMKDIFAVQDEIAETVVRQLRGALLGNGTAAPVPVGSGGATRNPEAYREYLQGRFFLNRHTEEDYQRAVMHLKRATEVDDGFAPAWAELGRVYSNMAQFGLGAMAFTEAFQNVRAAADRALALEPNLAYGHMLRAHVQMVHDWDVRAANRSIARALELAPGDASIVIVAGLMKLFVGETASAVEFARRAAELDPVNAQVQVYLSVVYFYAGDLPAAEASVRRALALSPTVMLGPSMLSYVCLVGGRLDEALAAAEREPTPHLRVVPLALACDAAGRRQEADRALRELTEKYSANMPFNIAQIYAQRGEVESAFMWLDRACAQRDSALVHAKLDPFLRKLHGDPRWRVFLARLGLAGDAPP